MFLKKASEAVMMLRKRVCWWRMWLTFGKAIHKTKPERVMEALRRGERHTCRPRLTVDDLLVGSNRVKGVERHVGETARALLGPRIRDTRDGFKDLLYKEVSLGWTIASRMRKAMLVEISTSNH